MSVVFFQYCCSAASHCNVPPLARFIKVWVVELRHPLRNLGNRPRILIAAVRNRVV
jgi:hypothetical protein